MHFLPDVYVPCETCHGQRYNRETLEVRFKGKSIADVLEMSVEEALEFFAKIPKIRRRLQTLHDVGLDYIKLGQPATTLSGGEAQRVKLAAELSKVATGRTLYILDEPTTGLHFADIEKLLEVLQRLVDAGNTVLVIEHNLDVIKQADWIVDLGPEGGDEGGEVIATGTPEEVAEVEELVHGAVPARRARRARGGRLRLRSPGSSSGSLPLGDAGDEGSGRLTPESMRRRGALRDDDSGPTRLGAGWRAGSCGARRERRRWVASDGLGEPHAQRAGRPEEAFDEPRRRRFDRGASRRGRAGPFVLRALRAIGCARLPRPVAVPPREREVALQVAADGEREVAAAPFLRPRPCRSAPLAVLPQGISSRAEPRLRRIAG